ncbi:MAG: Fe(2+) transporter FeoB [Owenweeksia sp. TMED14]|nr:MAG: Fe(2+) transporter FeoB [Owenweeksia sp. TMED14]
MMSEKKAIRVALVGRPNTGKSSLFNRLTGLNQKVGNYPGVTMEKTMGLSKWAPGILAEVIDLPGIYSLHSSSKDEQVVMDSLLNENSEEKIDVVIGLADGTNLKTCLFVFTQVIDLGIPAVLAVTMIDEMERKGMELQVSKLSESLGVSISLINARTGEGIEGLRANVINSNPSDKAPFFQPGGLHLQWIDKVLQDKKFDLIYKSWLFGLNTPDYNDLINTTGRSVARIRADEAIKRYRIVNQWLREFFITHPGKDRRWTARLDKWIVSPVWGSVILFGLMFLIFQVLFFGSEAPMNFIDDQVANLSNYLTKTLPSGFLTHLLTNGVMPGIAGVLIFIPQIALLFGFIALLEESGYMARVVFIMDRFMRPFGLSGKSVVPMVSGTACAIPAIMSTRNMENSRERWLAIAVTPLITCAARLPVYALIISLVIPDQSFFGMSLRGIVLFSLYLIGFITALLGSALLNKLMPKVKSNPFLLEMPSYRLPQLRNVGIAVINRTKSFVSEAGKIILAISVVLWFFASFGPDKSPDFTKDHVAIPIEDSYIGKMGKAIEPVMKPLGFDWKVSIAVLSSFVAREVFVGTMATLYSVDDDEVSSVREQMAKQKDPKTGEPYFNLAVGISLLLFYAFAMQCMSTYAVVARETRSHKFAAIQFLVLGILAYAAAFFAYSLLA